MLYKTRSLPIASSSGPGLSFRQEDPLAHTTDWPRVSLLIFGHIVPPFPSSLAETTRQLVRDVSLKRHSVCAMIHPFSACCIITRRAARAVRILAILIGDPPYGMRYNLFGGSDDAQMLRDFISSEVFQLRGYGHSFYDESVAPHFFLGDIDLPNEIRILFSPPTSPLPIRGFLF